MLNGFLLGVISSASLAVGLIFLKYWRRTRDPLFLSFAIAFIVEACNRVCLLFIDKPNEGKPVIYLVRLVVFLVLLIAIIKKYAARGPVRN
jgi:uncharacterized membrane protein HdeD (DUF308 family)